MQEVSQAIQAGRLGRYELLGELGRGAMGIVYRARDPIIDRVVALKTIDSGRSGEAAASFTERFFQEARSAGRLNHPNIVTIYDAGDAGGQAYIAMEFLEGTGLREMLDEQAPLPIARAVEIAGQVARGLAYAHEHGVVHRDVKPANIIILRNRRPKITDFGIARLGEADVLAGSRAGSPKYMSPEQIRGDGALDGRSDIFSLGAVLYEMLTGRQPFGGAEVVDIMRTVLQDTPQPPSAHNARVPPELDALVLRMLAKRPDERHPSARWLYRELRQLEDKLEKEPKRRRTPRRRPGAESLARGPDVGHGRRAPGAGRSAAVRADEALRRPARRGCGCRAGRRRRDRPRTVARRPAFARASGGGADSRRRAACRAGAARAASNATSRCAREAARARTTAEGAGARREEARACACRRTGARAAAGRGCRRAAAQACPASPAADREDRPRGVAVGRGLRRRQAARHDAAARRGRASARPASGRDPELRATAVSHVRRAAGRPDPADPPQFFELERAAARSHDWTAFRLRDDGTREPAR